MPGVGEIRDPGGPLLELDDLLGLGRERRVEHDVVIPEGDRRFRVALVEGLGPDERRRLVRHPVHVPRALGHAVQRDALLGGQVGDDLDEGAAHVPDLDRVREAVRGQGIRIGPLDPPDEKVFRRRRDRDRIEDAGLADLANGARGDIDDGQLGRRVIVEEDLVERVLEEVLVGGGLGFRAARDLDLGADGDARRDGGRAAALRDERDDDAAAVRRPFDPAEDGVDGGRRQRPGRRPSRRRPPRARRRPRHSGAGRSSGRRATRRGR